MRTNSVVKRSWLIMDNWSTCPRCQSNRVQKISKWIAPIALFATSGCLIWVGLLFPPVWLAIPVLWVLALIMLFGKDVWQCQDCKKAWPAKKIKESETKWSISTHHACSWFRSRNRLLNFDSLTSPCCEQAFHYIVLWIDAAVFTGAVFLDNLENLHP